MHSTFTLALAIAAELVATSSLKLSEGFSRPLPSVLTIVGYGIAFWLLSLTLRRMDVGVAYAIWSGAGTALMALIGWAWFAESLGWMKLGSIALIIVGVIGLHAGHASDTAAPAVGAASPRL